MRSASGEARGGPARGRRGLVLSAAVAAAAALALGGGPPARVAADAPSLAYRLAADEDREPSRRAVRGASWDGGRYAVASGESVTAFVSQSLAGDRDARGWAEFLGGLVHGAELSRVEAYFARLDEVEDLCGGPALGCYANNMLVSIGETVDGVSAEEVATHEYGHHVAHNRVNPPWRAIDYGTKRWASYVGVCARAAQGAVYPGDEGKHYELNPGEGFAEAYRVLNERRRGIPSPWSLVDRGFYPDDAALARIEQDVLQPWTEPPPKVTTLRSRRTVSVPIATPLDGDLSVALEFGRGASYDVALVAGSRTLARGLWSSARTQNARHTLCGERNVSLRVTRRSGPGRFVMRVSAP